MSTSIESHDHELISAYIDGELSGEDLAQAERLIAADPNAKRFADELRGLHEQCQQLPVGRFSDNLAERVLAEAERRIADGADRPMVAAEPERLEPEGEFGLPFGRSPRAWVWAGVAAAAAVMISFVGRPDTPPPRGAVAKVQPGAAPMQMNNLNQVAFDRIKQTMPPAQLVTLRTTPQGREALQRMLQQRGIQMASQQNTSQAPRVLAAAQRAGLVFDQQSQSPANDQLMLISADRSRASQLLSDLQSDEKIFRVEAERSPEQTDATEAIDESTESGAAVALPLRVSTQASIDPGQLKPMRIAPVRRVIVLRIVVTPPEQPQVQ